ncbi:MAG: carboxylesterase family protein [Deltaproteobacteria bacterium]|nr:carboxylesterase family protein [Deltaproteobacteria bacterium]
MSIIKKAGQGFSLVFLVVFFMTANAGGKEMNQPNSEISKPIKITSGLITGQAVEKMEDIQAFKGIPYAAPPVGSLRWKAPQPALPWEGIRACTQYGTTCPQRKLPPPFDRDYGKTSEDCLTLNIWSGAKNPDERRPVMVWIHGGGFYGGTASQPDFDGRVLARAGVVAVTINYRLGVFGFLAHPELTGESEHQVSGNYGLLDQIAALRWVRDNIAAFGGDPNRVTIFGESGGARSVCFLMISPLARGLFHRAIVQSGSLYRGIGHLKKSHDGLPPMEKEGVRIAKQLGCNTLQELRRKKAEEIFQTLNATTAPLLAPPGVLTIPDGVFISGPVIDGWAVPEDPVKRYENGQQADVPLITGSNQDEASLFLRAFQTWGKTLASSVAHFFPGHEKEILKLYAEYQESEFTTALNRLATDVVWTRPARATARTMEKVSSKAYLYQFTHRRPGSLYNFGAFHGAEIRFAFGHDIGANNPFTEIDRRISKTMRTYWLNFAATGNPNGPGLPEWPAYEKSTDQSLEIGIELKIQTHLRKEACDLFDKIDKR